MNILSLFNGMSVGKMALESLNIPVTKYYSSEIDKYANQATQALFPGTIQLGSVTEWRDWDIDWSSIDLVTGGFPCQAWSIVGKQLGDKDERGMLFWAMLDIMKHIKYHNPKADFLIENVKMKKEFEQYITTHTENALGHVHKILINSALVSAQNRNRYYWTSFSVDQPEDKDILLKDVIEKNTDAKFNLSNKMMNGFFNKVGDFGNRFKPLTANGSNKANTITARYFKMAITDNYIVTGNTDSNGYGVNTRKLTPRECMRLQTVPEYHIDTLLSSGISNTQLYKLAGNGWTMEVIKHIFKARYKQC